MVALGFGLAAVTSGCWLGSGGVVVEVEVEVLGVVVVVVVGVVEEAAAGAGFSASAAGVVSVVSAVVRFAIGAVNEAMV